MASCVTLHVAVGRSPMVPVAAGSVDLRVAHCVAGKQACGDVAAVVLQGTELAQQDRAARSLRGRRERSERLDLY